MTAERWAAIPEFPHYEVSDLGRPGPTARRRLAVAAKGVAA